MIIGNKNYASVDDLPASIPVFPLTGALLLPRGQMPLNIFEPRYLAMVDAALAGDRLIGMIQPKFSPKAAPKSSNAGEGGPDLCRVGCVGRIVSFSETGDGRYHMTLVGVSRFSVISELETTTLFRQVMASWDEFAGDLNKDMSHAIVDRRVLLKTFRDFLDANNMAADWSGIETAETESLVNALSMMCPYGAAEKQALLEAIDLKTRAETLVALTEMMLARQAKDGDVVLQ